MPETFLDQVIYMVILLLKIVAVVLPLILGIYVMISAMNNPDGSLPFWFSIIPRFDRMWSMFMINAVWKTQELVQVLVILSGGTIP